MFGGVLGSALPFVGVVAFQSLEVWRAITYPLYMGLFTVIGGGLIAYFFGSELETIIGTKRYAILLVSLVLSASVILYLISPFAPLFGPLIISMFIIAGFVYLAPHTEIFLFGRIPVKVWILGLIYLVFSILPTQGTRLDTSSTNLFAPFYAVLFAFVLFQILFRKYAFGRGFFNLFARSGKKSNKSRTMDSELSTQARVDAILDKISERGMQSLNEEERDFLKRYG